MAEKGAVGGGGPAGGITPLQQILASGTGAIVTSIFMTPLDVVKVRLQSQRSAPTQGRCFLYCNGILELPYVCQNGGRCATWYPAPTHFTGTVDAFVKIIRQEGARTLWSGLPPTLVMAVPATAIYFTTYDQLRSFLSHHGATSDLYAPLVAGAVARLGTVTVVSPLELVRTKLQSQALTYQELRVSIRGAVAQGGWRSLWQGWGPTVLRDVPFSALYWFNYELVKRRLEDWMQSDRASVSISFLAGALSGTVAAALTLPFDVVKTHRQIDLGKVETLRVTSPRSPSTWLLLRKIRVESGTRGLFAGWSETCSWGWKPKSRTAPAWTASGPSLGRGATGVSLGPGRPPPPPGTHRDQRAGGAARARDGSWGAGGGLVSSPWELVFVLLCSPMRSVQCSAPSKRSIINRYLLSAYWEPSTVLSAWESTTELAEMFPAQNEISKYH
uniref:Mitochondrial glutathione transporter SLC25A40 n=1 Tax=Ornithorhynchus anatinus TaxID=9258 RepID=A0A6I8NL42_ORNAN